MTRRVRVLLVIVLCGAGIAVPASGAQLQLSSTTLTTFRTCTLSATNASGVVAVDAGVRQDTPLTNAGTAASADVRSALLSNRRLYVRFDLTRCAPAISASATVTSATLRLFMTSRPNQCRTHGAYRVTAAWTEGGITWNNQPASAAAPSGSVEVGNSPCANATNNVYVSGWDVTADVAQFVSGTTNHGWLIRDVTESSANTREGSYATREAADASRAPQLIVGYR